MRLRHRRSYGFTLLEILVVVGVISILTALLVPVFSKVRETSRISTCASNLRQINLSVQQYVQDTGGYYPSAMEFPFDCSWVDRVYPYVKTPKIFQCPSLTDGRGDYQPGCPPDTRIGDEDDPDSFLAHHDGSYALNALRNATVQGNLSGSVSEVRLQHPTDTILILDGSGHSWVNPGVQTPLDKPEITVAELQQGDVAVRHRGGDNVLFVDGHLKWLRIEALTERNLWLARKTR